MTISAYKRAGDILHDLRQCILELPSQGSSEQKYCKEIKELYDELDMICRKTHTVFFKYVHHGMSYELAQGRVIVLNTGENVRVMCREIDIDYECTEGSKCSWKEAKRSIENVLIFQAGKWLKSNRESLSSVTLQEEETTLGHDIKLPDNPTRKQIAKYFNELTGKDYAYRTIEAYISEVEAGNDKINPIDGKKKQPYRYPTDIVEDKIIPFLHQKAADGRK